MEEKVNGNRQENQNADDSSFPSASVVANIQSHCQGSTTKDRDLPIMHWEDLSLCIEKLEKQEKERRKKSESIGLTEDIPEYCSHDNNLLPHRKEWEGNLGECRFPFITSRFTSPKKLQLCFINNSDSDQEDDDGAKSKEVQSSCESHHHGCRSTGLRKEVQAALSALRDKLWAEEKQQQLQQLTCNDVRFRRKKLSCGDLQTCSVLQLNALCASLHEEIQDLSSELVKHLVVRDHLRNKQDAMLLDVQDMTSL